MDNENEVIFKKILQYMIDGGYKYMQRLDSDVIAFARDERSLFTNHVICMCSKTFKDFTENMEITSVYRIKNVMSNINKFRKSCVKFGHECAIIYNRKNCEKYRVELSPNRQLSIIRGHYTYGGELGLWEIGLMDNKGDLIYNEFDDIFHGDVVGYLTDEEVEQTIRLLKESLDDTNSDE